MLSIQPQKHACSDEWHDVLRRKIPLLHTPKGYYAKRLYTRQGYASSGVDAEDGDIPSPGFCTCLYFLCKCASFAHILLKVTNWS